MAEHADMYYEEVGPSNQLKGFTKAFEKRSKDKREEDPRVKELLGFAKENKLIVGAKRTQKAFYNNSLKKVFFSTNPKDLTAKTIEHYAKLSNVEIVRLDLDNDELAQKLGKPFLISMVGVMK